jgi:hypothetical protein
MDSGAVDSVRVAGGRHPLCRRAEAVLVGRDWRSRRRNDDVDSRGARVRFRRPPHFFSRLVDGVCLFICLWSLLVFSRRRTSRNWDYRYCWLRDSHFSVAALVALSKHDVLEDYISFIINVANEQLRRAKAGGGDDGDDDGGDDDGGGDGGVVVVQLQPMFGIDLRCELPESEKAHLRGYRNHAPVRVGNLAWQQQQNDGYGAVVLSCAHVFFDTRLARLATDALFGLLVELARIAATVYATPDAGNPRAPSVSDVALAKTTNNNKIKNKNFLLQVCGSSAARHTFTRTLR